jgi:hypothetical protein
VTPEAITADDIATQREFSTRTFGPGPRTAGVLDHIRKELVEIEDTPYELGEWIDVLILAFDGAWRSGHEPDVVIMAYHQKMAINMERDWPDWRNADCTKAIEHVREEE